MKLSKLFKEIYEDHYKKQRFEKSGYLDQVRMNWKNHLRDPFGHLPIKKITSPKIYAWHKEYENSPYAGNRSKALLSKMFSFAELTGYISPGSNPCSVVPNHLEKKRRRYASPSEIKAITFILARDVHQYPREVIFIYLLMYTGSRPSAVARFKWGSLQRYKTHKRVSGVISVAGKAGEEFIIIPHFLLGILDFLPAERTDKILGIDFPRKYWEAVRKEAGCPDLWARDFRRTFGVTGLSCGVTLGAVGELMSHKNTQTTKRYVDLMLDERVMAANKISERLGEFGETGSQGRKYQ